MTTSTTLTTSMGPAHVGQGHTDHPSILNYGTLGEAMERQRNRIGRMGDEELAPGYCIRFYVGDDDAEPAYVGRLVYRGTHEPGVRVVEWEYAEGWHGPEHPHEAELAAEHAQRMQGLTAEDRDYADEANAAPAVDEPSMGYEPGSGSRRVSR